MNIQNKIQQEQKEMEMLYSPKNAFGNCEHKN